MSRSSSMLQTSRYWVTRLVLHCKAQSAVVPVQTAKDCCIARLRSAIVPVQTAKDHLEKALKEASREGCAVTEAELAEHHYKLGRILWTMGGNMRDDPTMARGHFEAASKEECDSQVPLLTRPAASKRPGPADGERLDCAYCKHQLGPILHCWASLSAQLSPRHSLSQPT